MPTVAVIPVVFRTSRMIVIHLLARKNIIWAATGIRLSDNELEYFKGILNGPMKRADANSNKK